VYRDGKPISEHIFPGILHNFPSIFSTPIQNAQKFHFSALEGHFLPFFRWKWKILAVFSRRKQYPHRLPLFCRRISGMSIILSSCGAVLAECQKTFIVPLTVLL